jgi:hypothetical protein
MHFRSQNGSTLGNITELFETKWHSVHVTLYKKEMCFLSNNDRTAMLADQRYYALFRLSSPLALVTTSAFVVNDGFINTIQQHAVSLISLFLCNVTRYFPLIFLLVSVGLNMTTLINVVINTYKNLSVKLSAVVKLKVSWLSWIQLAILHWHNFWCWKSAGLIFARVSFVKLPNMLCLQYLAFSENGWFIWKSFSLI